MVPNAPWPRKAKEGPGEPRRAQEAPGSSPSIPSARYIAIDTFSIASARRPVRCRERVSMLHIWSGSISISGFVGPACYMRSFRPQASRPAKHIWVPFARELKLCVLAYVPLAPRPRTHPRLTQLIQVGTAFQQASNSGFVAIHSAVS